MENKGLGEERSIMSTKDRVALWKKEREAGKVSWDSFVEANATFDGDYKIVGHPELPKPGIFDTPNDLDVYSLSTVAGMTVEQYKEKTDGKKVVVLVMCMDRRAQRQTYDEVQKANPDAVIIVLSMGGGIVQQDEIIRPEGKVEAFRSEALKTELAFIQENTPGVEVVHVTGHDCQCGACKFYNNNVAVHEVLKVDKGSESETQEMAKRVEVGTVDLVPQSWIDAGIVKKSVVHIDPKTDAFDKMVNV